MDLSKSGSLAKLKNLFSEIPFIMDEWNDLIIHWFYSTVFIATIHCLFESYELLVFYTTKYWVESK